MAKKKSKFSVLRKDKRFKKALPMLLVGAGMIFGLLAAWLQPPNVRPRNLVWASDPRVQVPDGLTEFLYKQPACAAHQGDNSPKGVGLWAVYQSSQNRFAKLAYGCSTDMTLYIMAVKDGPSWKLLPTKEYFADNSKLPKCAMIDRYGIDETIEPFCIGDDAIPRENTKK